ncbi:hypothetical protein K435DRAFT_822154 [Dendrothele bispora CBS 962.96]|uniref:Rab-GAP TBC domain-containing protein n=1 Tax=Dendrothele bispora (strain CBS 962.96) TaxID=1314807 RepID=A0A4S8LCU9_DENBC|nr:hypothetical protein K435DRAFT_822154 [Dendrothele bispora CBS 962.96]
MTTPQWDASFVKAQIRLASQKLGQLQDKNDSKSNITRRDISTLLQQGDVGLARIKAQNLIQEDAFGDLLEMLEMQLGILLERFNEVEQGSSPSPTVVEAAMCIIFSAPQLLSVRDLLCQKLGSDFARSAATISDEYVSPRALRTLSIATPTAAQLDAYLSRIAKVYGVAWAPEPRRQDILNSLSEILDPDSAPSVDIASLRRLCARGIPDEPAWLRPRIWKIFLGTLPVLKRSWQGDTSQQRNSYYDLVRRLLKPFTDLPAPSTPSSSLDATLLKVAKQFASIPPSLFDELEIEPELSSACPLDSNSLETVRITYADALDVRLKQLQNKDTPAVPDIRLEQEESRPIPDVFVTSESFPSSSKPASTLLVSPRAHAGTHDKHTSALLRLLFVHSSINPGNLSPHIPALLIPLYTILHREVEPDDLAHIEADCFWLFEAMVGEFSELEDEEGGNVWMMRFGERLAWADRDLSENLLAKGLDPALPHYSYRWLAPLLIHTLPISSVIVIWDALFSRPMRQKGNPKLEYLVDICTAMLLRARSTLLRLGKAGPKSPSLWSEDIDSVPPPSPIRAWELGDAFMEGMSLLQHYPIDAAGGVDRILQTASDLRHKREQEAKNSPHVNNLSVGARLRETMWKGFTNQISPERSPSSSDTSDDETSPDDGDDTETQVVTSPGLTSRLATTVWRGITNQSSMEAPPSPLSPARSPSPQPDSPLPSTVSDGGVSPDSNSSNQSTGLWGYAEKLKDSDTAASLAKLSSNWRAKAMMTSWGMGAKSNSPQSHRKVVSEGVRRGSLPELRRPEYSPPPRPAFFRPPRDTMIFSPDQALVQPDIASPELSPQSDSGILRKTMNLQASLAALTKSEAPRTPKSGPRPLLLNSSSLMTTRDQRGSVSEASTPNRAEHSRQWSEVMQAKRHALHRDSQSSVSSLSPSDALGRGHRSDRESDSTPQSRKIPLNRRSVSPMAPHHRTLSSRQLSYSSSERGLLSPGSISQTEFSNGGFPSSSTRTEPDSPLAPKTPISSKHNSAEVRITEGDNSQDSSALAAGNMSPLEPPKKLTRKKTPPRLAYRPGDTSDSSAPEMPSISPRLRTKRHPPRPAHLRVQEVNNSHIAVEQDDSLAVDWPREESELINTPRASEFDSEALSSPSPPAADRKVSVDRPRKLSSDTIEPRTRKTSGDSRTRKTSFNGKRRNRESRAEDGDDEGYDELLSAYESEEGSKSFH